jgi:hypothetical protein
MSVIPPRRWFEIAAIGATLIQLGVMAYRLQGMDGLLLADGQPMFGDFIAFWSGARIALNGDIELVHNIQAIQAQHQIAIPGLPVLTPYNSPPTFLLLILPLGLLSFPAAAISFLVATGALFVFAARKILPDTRALIFALTLPAALFHIGSVQTGLLIAGASALALTWLDRRPIAAAAMIALVAVKPHLALLWPVLLIVTRRWRALVFSALFTAALLVAAGLAFGFDAYQRFIENLPNAQNLITDRRVAAETFASLYGDLLGLGMPQAPAAILHGLSALAALIVAVLVFLRGGRAEHAAALCAATMLISPYLYFYDTTLLAVGAAFLGAPRNRIETMTLVLAWSAGLTVALGVVATLPLSPLAAWMLLLTASGRAGIAAPRPAPAQHT